MSNAEGPRLGQMITSTGIGTENDRPVITVEDVWFSYGERSIVAGVNFEVWPGERVAILGSTGAGKSTLLNLLIGSLVPQAGAVKIAGLAPSDRERELFGRFAMAFQSPRLLPWRTTLDNVALGLEILGSSRSKSRHVAHEWLERVGLSDAGHLYPSQLSGGMRQRASLARAFAIRPDVLFLDEAFSALDEVTAETLRKDFRDLSVQESTTAVIVTHDIDEALYLADRVLILGKPACVAGEFSAHQRGWHGNPDRSYEVRSEILRILQGSRPSMTLDSPHGVES